MKRVLAVDLGASSGRAILGSFDGEKITLNEIHRFSNDPVMIHGTFYWDILRLFHEIKQGIVIANNNGGFDSIGVDTWGVDFGLIDKEGRLLENPVHYRDIRTKGMLEECFQLLSKEEIYKETGNEFLELNTLYQLVYLIKQRKDLMERADKLLFIPDLITYFLTGKKSVEYSIASTSQLLNIETKDWSRKIIDTFQIPKNLLPDIVDSSSVVGFLSDEICEELSCQKSKVIAVCEHDTASAVVAIPTQSEEVLYLSCGTWSLFGTESKAPILNDFSFTNEGGFGKSVRYLKNIVGLWMIQESRREWKRQGQNYSFAELENLAVEAGKTKCYIDPDYPSFAVAGNLPKRIQEYCKDTNQYIPKTVGEIVRCIYESLAKKFAETKISLEKVTGRKYNTLHIIGGGIKDTFLCQMTSNYCKCKVVAGPTEATALGNVAVQLISCGSIKDVKQAREIISNSVELKMYYPN